MGQTALSRRRCTDALGTSPQPQPQSDVSVVHIAARARQEQHCSTPTGQSYSLHS